MNPQKRVAGLLRDAWFLVIPVVGGGALLWWLIAPIAGVAAIVLSLVTFAYFGVVRYDDDGRERSSDRM